MAFKGRQSTNIEDQRNAPPSTITNEDNKLDADGPGFGGAPVEFPIPTPRPHPNTLPRSPAVKTQVTPGDWKTKNSL